MTHKIKKTLPQIQQTLDTVCALLKNAKQPTSSNVIKKATRQLETCGAAIESLREISPHSEIHLIRELVSSAIFYRDSLLRTANVDDDIREIESEDGEKVNRAEYIEYKLKYMTEDLLEYEEDFKETYEYARILLQRFGFDIEKPDADFH